MPFKFILWEHLRRAGRGRRPQGFRSLRQILLIRSFQTWLVCSIISQNSTSTLELWPFNCPMLGFPISKSKSFYPVFIKLSEYVGGHNISTNFYNLPNPPGTPELWPLNCPKMLSITLNLSQLRRTYFV